MNAVVKQHTMKERLLTIDNLNVSYDKTILNAVNGHIDNVVREGFSQGQIVSLLGPSGVGKTQLFRCIAGLQTPNAGGVYLKGSKTPVRPGDVGVVAQSYPLFNHRTVLGNLLVAALKLHKTHVEARDKCYAALEEWGLADKANNYPLSLSGGQRQRLAIAQQLLCSSHFLLMDEPFSGLDPVAKDRACESILRVAGMNELNTIIVITHDIESAVRISDTVWVLGRDFDANGICATGARIQETHNLIEMGLAWDEQITEKPLFFDFCNQLKTRFKTL